MAPTPALPAALLATPAKRSERARALPLAPDHARHATAHQPRPARHHPSPRPRHQPTRTSPLPQSPAHRPQPHATDRHDRSTQPPRRPQPRPSTALRATAHTVAPLCRAEHRGAMQGAMMLGEMRRCGEDGVAVADRRMKRLGGAIPRCPAPVARAPDQRHPLPRWRNRTSLRATRACRRSRGTSRAAARTPRHSELRARARAPTAEASSQPGSAEPAGDSPSHGASSAHTITARGVSAIGFSPQTAIGSLRRWPCRLPAGGHRFSPARCRREAEAVGRSGAAIARCARQARGITPLPAVACASR